MLRLQAAYTQPEDTTLHAQILSLALYALASFRLAVELLGLHRARSSATTCGHEAGLTLCTPLRTSDDTRKFSMQR
jgi:hypothetical protein